MQPIPEDDPKLPRLAGPSGRIPRGLGHAAGVTSICREHIESFLVALAEKGLKPATLAVAYRSIRPFFRWLVDEDEITRSPMERMRQPAVPEPLVPILTEVQLRALLDTTRGRGYVDRRDRAILMLFIDSGARLSEIAGLKVDDLDLERNNTALVMGKGRLPLGHRVRGPNGDGP